MTGYTKLFSSIVGSTIWRADNETRIVWVTLLALADRDGCVEASIPGLADFARVSLPACERAIQALEAPDQYSRSKDLDGRRIMPIDGGWQLVNHAKYRQAGNADDRREYLRKKQQEYRDRLKASVNTASTNVNKRIAESTESTQAEAEATPDPDPTQKDQKLPRTKRARPSEPPPGFAIFWSAYPKHVNREAAIKAWRKVDPQDYPAIEAALAWQRNQPKWRENGGEFIPHASSWLNKRRWEDEPFQLPADDDDQLERVTAGRGRFQ